MDRIWMHTIKRHQRKFFAYVLGIFILMGSCPVKSGIKSLMGIPVNAEQRVPKNHTVPQVTGAEKCASTEVTATKIIQTNPRNTGGWLPMAFLILVFIRLPEVRLTRTQLHPRYGSLKIPGPLPVFLRCRRLII